MKIKTEADFVKQAIRDAREIIHIPPSWEGWWGEHNHVRGPNGVEVKRHHGTLDYDVLKDGKIVFSGTRETALRKAKRLMPKLEKQRRS